MLLVTKDSKGKIRLIRINLNQIDNTYTITRESGLWEGKKTAQPLIVIEKGKAKRTVLEQATLQYNSEIKKLKDKGYKEVSEGVSFEEVKEMFKDYIKTDPSGNFKPMLAKAFKDCDPNKIDNKEWYISRKLNGVRANILLGEDGLLHAIGRGASTYDIAIQHILQNEKLINFFKCNPNIILDGECYHHGTSLQDISGKMRQEKEMIPILEFYVYDIVDPTLTFEERLNKLKLVEKELDLYFLPSRTWQENDLKIQIVPHEKVHNLKEIDEKHDQFVKEGFEGAVIRNPKCKYLCGERNLAMVKVKKYLDDCFEVVGIQQGLRMYDDMVFILKTKDGQYFHAKPFGNQEQKIEYTNNFEKLYKGHLGECKFFEYSDKGIPCQPNFVAFRFDLKK